MNDKQEFIEAVENDEYAEYRLETGDILITDWEGDGYFNPYVLVDEDKEPTEEVANEIDEAIAEEFDVAVYHTEFAEGGDTLYPDMDRPE